MINELAKNIYNWVYSPSRQTESFNETTKSPSWSFSAIQTINCIGSFLTSTCVYLYNRVSENIQAFRGTSDLATSVALPHFEKAQNSTSSPSDLLIPPSPSEISISKDLEINSIKKLQALHIYLDIDQCLTTDQAVNIEYLKGILDRAHQLDVSKEEPHLQHLINSYAASLITLAEIISGSEKSSNKQQVGNPQVNLIKIKDDGNCLFRSVSVALDQKRIRQASNNGNLNGDDHFILRTEACNYIKSHLNDLEIQLSLLEDFLSFQATKAISTMDSINTYSNLEIEMSSDDRALGLANAHADLENLTTLTQEDYLKELVEDRFFAGTTSIISLSLIHQVAIRTKYADNIAPDQVYKAEFGREITVIYHGNHYDTIYQAEPNS